jgi:hypothetical protein
MRFQHSQYRRKIWTFIVSYNFFILFIILASRR